MKKIILYLAAAMSFATANAQSRIQPGTETALAFLQDTRDLTCGQTEDDINSRLAGGVRCNILNHTPYSNPSGVACVNCGGTYVSVTWTTDIMVAPGLSPREYQIYESTIVSNCNW